MSTKIIAGLKKGLIQIALFLPIVFGLLLISNPISSARAQIYPGINTFPPQTAFPLANSIASQQLAYPYLPPPQTTFAPSVFPPTQSFLPGTSFAVPTGNLSPWFPSVPAIACGGTFSLTIVGEGSSSKHKGSKHDDHGNSNDNDNSNNGKKTIALQVLSAGRIALDQNSISGKIFEGKTNINNNKGNKLNLDNLSDNCIAWRLIILKNNPMISSTRYSLTTYCAVDLIYQKLAYLL